jgi:probable rRNA maturation factor
MAAARLRVSVATPDSAPAKSGGASSRQAPVRPSRKRTASAGQALEVRGLGAWLVKHAPAKARGDLSIAIVSDRRMRALNRQFRGKDTVTDVLSFPSDQRGFLGDIVIAAGVSTKQAKAAGHPIQTEVRVLALHGLLHLIGYDHESDDGKMARAEMRLRRKAGLTEGLIERTK